MAGAGGLAAFRRVVPAHTFGPHVRDKLKINLWPSVHGESEPLDCDEAAYAYIGHRILAGDVLYRDLTENKPPLGYWIYTLAVAVGGYNELAIRVMPIPFILATIALVWWIAHRLAGRVAACVAAGLFILLSTDPYLFGNGANLEHFINFFSVAVARLVDFWLGPCERLAPSGLGALPGRGRAREAVCHLARRDHRARACAASLEGGGLLATANGTRVS